MHLRETRPGSMSMEDLYKTLQALSLRVGETEPERPDVEHLADGLNAAIKSVAETIVASFPETARAAAAVGSTRVDVLRFQGGQLDESSGFPLLTMVKGPRDPDLKALVPATLLDTLREKLTPFHVTHVWHNRSNVNRIVVSWEPHPSDPRPPHQPPPLAQIYDVLRLALAAKSAVPL
jgi:hypothetical protein